MNNQIKPKKHTEKKIKDYFYSQSDLFMGNMPDIGEKGYFANTVEELSVCCITEYKNKINNIYPKLQFAFETFSKTANNEPEKMTYALFLPEYNKNVFMCIYEQAKELEQGNDNKRAII